jgi:hypothetical protein
VLDPIALEDADRAVVHQGRDRNRELALGRPQHLAHPVVDADPVRGGVELPLGDLEQVLALLCQATLLAGTDPDGARNGYGA